MLAKPLKTIFKKFLSVWFTAAKPLQHFFKFEMVGLRNIHFNQSDSTSVSTMGSQIYICGTILTRLEVFTFGSVIFSMFLRVLYPYACLVATIK